MYCVSQTLLPKIVELWELLHVPLVHRSRFFLAFRGRETFYYEVHPSHRDWPSANGICKLQCTRLCNFSKPYRPPWTSLFFPVIGCSCSTMCTLRRDL